jgi:uncharacterized protein with von Willebrand factor type A (vWA) domain
MSIKVSFSPSVKGVLAEDYTNPLYRSLARSVLSNFLLENKRIPFFVALDSSILHYKPWSAIVFNPHIKGGWKAVLENYYNSDTYKNLNNAIAGDPLLAKYATIHFLNALFKKSQDQLNQMSYRPYAYNYQPQSSENPIGELMNWLDKQIQKGNTQGANQVIQELTKKLEDEAKEIMEDLRAAENFSHVGIPVAQLLEKPDEFREKARNKIIVNLVRFLQKLRKEAPELKRTKSPTLVGGRPLGVKRLQRFSELTRILPMEFLDDDLLTYKIASRTVRVSEQYGNIQNYVVYLDKSGSMSESIIYRASPTQADYVPKISFAAASALALAMKLKNLGAKMTLKLFDVDVHDPVSDFAQIIDILTRIRADSGTNLTRVLQDALKFRDEKIIIVSDGIDEINEQAVKDAKAHNLDITVVFIKTDNELLKKNFPHIYLQEAKPEVLLNI